MGTVYHHKVVHRRAVSHKEIATRRGRGHIPMTDHRTLPICLIVIITAMFTGAL